MLRLLVNREWHRLQQRLFRVSNLLRDFRLMTVFLRTIRTMLVLWTASSWRVTMKSAWLDCSVVTVCRSSSLAWALIESAVLLRTSRDGLDRNVCVTATSRPLLIDMPEFLLLTIALQFLGNERMKWLMQAVSVVVWTRRLAVLGCLHVTPLWTALRNS